jgi:glycosyltransferase involved in cell wall biosynthesis
LDISAEIQQQYYKRIHSYLLNYKPGEKRWKIDNCMDGAKKRKLTVAYIMNHVRVCGGVKIIFEHTQRLVERGHDVYIVSHAARPDWFDLKAEFITVPPQFSRVQYVPEDVDIIVCTVADQLPECFLLSNKPVVMFEQGDTYIFEFEKNPPGKKEYFAKLWSIPVPVFGVSKVLVDTLQRHFGVQGTIIHNALDPNIYYPRAEHSNPSKPAILFVGREDVPFKGIQDVRKALEIVRESGRAFDEVWVTQVKPKSSFEGKLYVDPSQAELGNIYRMCDIYVSGSYYESFSLPPLEAMACGCAVVSTDNEGVLEYAQHGVNCLLGKVGDPGSLAQRIIELIDDQQKREYLVQNGYQTATRFNWNNIMSQWEDYLGAIVQNWETGRYPGLLIKRLPSYLSQQEAARIIQDVVSHMEEEYCLWLFEGEALSDSDVERIRHILSHSLSSIYALQVQYSKDIPEHPVARLENRIFKRHSIVSDVSDLSQSMVIPVQLEGVGDSCFLPDWLRETRLQYSRGDYEGIIVHLKSRYAALSQDDKPVAVKWLALALMEKDRLTDCMDVLSKAMQSFPSYSDLSYLLGRVLLFAGDVKRAEMCFKLAKTSGTAALFKEYFHDIEKICSMYLQ